MAPSPATDQWSRVGGTLLQIRAESLAEDMAFIVEKGLAGVMCYEEQVALLVDYRLPELCVRDHLVFAPTSKSDLSNIALMTHLTRLTLDCEGLRADLRCLDRLEKLEVVAGKHVLLPLQTPLLRRLRLHKFSPQPSDLTALPGAPLLDCLWVGVGSLALLAGIERFCALDEIRLAWLPKLTRIGPLATLPKLRSLYIENCANVGDIEALRGARTLEVLEIHNKSIASLAFLNDLPALRQVNVGKTNVLDGDLSPLLRIASVNFVNRKHYSHTRQGKLVKNEYGHDQIEFGPMRLRRQ
ncbi:MAG: hypothetical protein V4850_21585 [Myxococcota bacterium]